MVFNPIKLNGKKHTFFMFLNPKYADPKSTLRLFHVHMGSVRHGWIGCVSAVKNHSVTKWMSDGRAVIGKEQ